MATIARLGIDTSKSLFQLHGVNEREEAVLRKQVRRGQFLAFVAKLAPTEIGLEACGASHHWARQLKALGHEVVLLPPQHVKPYVGLNKNDKIDAAAICEAMSRPKIRERFVAVKSAEQSAAQMLLGTRDGLLHRRTQLSNTIRGHAAEFGLVTPKGLAHIPPLLERVATDESVPALAKELFATLGEEFAELGPRIAQLDKKLKAFQRSNELCRRLVEVPTIGPVIASSMVVKISNPAAFRSARRCAAWLGLTPKDHSTAGKTRHGGITRAGDEGLRAALVSGATAYIQQVKRGRTKPSPWLAELLKRKPKKLAAVALANKTARIAWKLMVSGERYDRARAEAREGLGAAQRRGSAPSPSLHPQIADHGASAMTVA
jgi:transposase